MSVVNKMLQDLEARQVNASKVNADYQPPTQSFRWLRWLVGVSLVLLLVLLYWLYGQKLTHQAVVQTPQKIMVSAEQSPVSPAAKVMVEPESPADLAVAALNPGVTEAVDYQLPSETTDLALQSVGLNSQTDDMLDPAPQQISSLNAETAGPSAAAPKSEPSPSAFAIKDSSQASQSRSLKQQISDALASKNNNLAMRLLSDLLEQQPANFEALKKLASLLFADGQITQASNRLLAAIQVAPERADLRLMLARLYIQQQQPDLALALLQELNAVALPIDYLAFRANLAQQQADYATAHQDYLRLTFMDDSNARWWLGLAIIEEKRGASASVALQAYQRAQNLAQLEPAVSDFIAQRIKLLTGTP